MRLLYRGCLLHVYILNYLKFQSSKNRRRHSRKTEPESEDSDSDQDPLTSSRTESSNQLDGKIKHSQFRNYVLKTSIANKFFFTDIIYHGNQSSTSSDLSPMSEQKSLPRRGRSRYHAHTYTTNTTPRHKPAPSPTLLASSSPRSISSNNKTPRMPSQFRPIQHRTITNSTCRQSPSC